MSKSGMRTPGTLPDIREEQPKPIWTQPRLGLTWRGPVAITPAELLPKGFKYYAQWESPWFDLRPDLRSIEAQPKLGVPIWSRSARLYIELVGTTTVVKNAGTGANEIKGSGFYPNNYKATGRDYYDIVNIDPGQLPAKQPGRDVNQDPSTSTLAVDISPILFPASSGPIITSLGVFAPPGTASGTGEGYPVRYWKYTINFTYYNFTPLATATPPDQIALQAGYY